METLAQKLSLLGHPSRLEIFQLLLRRYPDSLPAGEIAQVLALKPNTLSAHLNQLHHAALVTRTRQGTSLRYQLALAGARGLLEGLFLDCCRGRPDLCTLAPTLTVPSERRLSVLFICTANAARSLFAEALLRKKGGAQFAVTSAGTEPNATPHPMARDLLQNAGHDLDSLHPKPLSALQKPGSPAFDFVFTLCDRAANEPCPTWPGVPICAHWGVPDPAAVTGSDAQRRAAFETAYTTLAHRIDRFLHLPFASADAAHLQRAVDALGQEPLPI